MSEYMAVVMAGGSGTRFWPMSRAHLPKQLLPLLGPRTMVRETVERLFPLFDASRVYVICGRAQKELIQQDLDILEPEHVLDEPVPRDTAGCVGLAAVFLDWRAPGSTFCALPSDAWVGGVDKFQETLRLAYEAAQEGALVTIGIRPTRPATGYGYLERGEPAGRGAWRVKKFWEKPDVERARDFVASGRHLWNAGMFVWRTDRILEEFRRHLPEHHARLREIRSALGTRALPQVLGEAFARMPKISVDYGIMEKVSNAVLIEAPFEWDDVGSWSAAGERRARDAEGNAVEARSTRVDTRDCVIISSDDDHLIATLGAEGLVIVHTRDATLVCPRDRAEDVKKLVEKIRADGHDSHL